MHVKYVEKQMQDQSKCDIRNHDSGFKISPLMDQQKFSCKIKNHTSREGNV